MIENINNRTLIIIISIIWGLGLSFIFSNTCKGKKCRIVKYAGPDIKYMKKNYFNYGTKNCYKYYPLITKCKL